MKKNIILFKNNLRVNDNPVLKAASFESLLLPVYIHDESYKTKKLGSASLYFLYHSLKSLSKSLDYKLQFFKGDTCQILTQLVKEHNIECIYVEEFFDREEIDFFDKLKSTLYKINVKLKIINSQLLWNPKNILKDDNTPYKVFSPFYKRKCIFITPEFPVGQVSELNFIDSKLYNDIDSLSLLSKYPWYKKFDQQYDISENGALDILSNFIIEKIHNYKVGRDYPGEYFNSKLSPFIRFGLLSINRIWHEVNSLPESPSRNHYLSELGWREFSYYQLYHFPEMAKKNLQNKFDNYEWENDMEYFEAWKMGNTGYPFVDAGMRELWKTGFMHNRLRMIVASFLVKNLQIDWRLGEEWFWDCLIDADYASNVAGWQWAAGTGVDAAPYFRIFNPILQGKKFDAEGKYIKTYIPEISSLDIKTLHEPWTQNHGLDYPKPIIDFKQSRNKALSLYSSL